VGWWAGEKSGFGARQGYCLLAGGSLLIREFASGCGRAGASAGALQLQLQLQLQLYLTVEREVAAWVT
jgi:hypothetical protein